MVSNLFDYNAEEENTNLTAFYNSFKKLVAMHKPKTLNNYKALINYLMRNLALKKRLLF